MIFSVYERESIAQMAFTAIYIKAMLRVPLFNAI